jgi:hypothetical protein
MEEKKCIICYQEVQILKDFVYCKNCFHVQLNTHPENKENKEIKEQEVELEFGIASMIRYGVFNKYNKKDYNDPVELKILDINCINTNQLDVFFKMNKVCGFNLTTVGINGGKVFGKVNESCENCHKVYENTFFTQETVDKLKEKFNNFDIMFIQNDFENTSDPHTFLKLCKQLMNNDTLLFIQSNAGFFYSPILSLNKLSFYNTNSMSILAKMCDLRLNRVCISGSNYIFEIINNQGREDNPNVFDQLYKELEKNMYSPEFYDNQK